MTVKTRSTDKWSLVLAQTQHHFHYLSGVVWVWDQE